MNRKIGIGLMIIGASTLIWAGFIKHSEKQKLIEVGSVEVTIDKKQGFNWPPYIGGVMFVGGMIIAIANRNQPV
jgi:hypothetical protein